MYECKFCGKDLSSRGKGKTKRKPTLCGSCSVSKRRWKAKCELVTAAGGKCHRCGWGEHPAALQFHHIDPVNKKFALTGNNLLKEKNFYKEELTKCILLCANCHAIEHQNGDRFFQDIGFNHAKTQTKAQAPSDSHSPS